MDNANELIRSCSLVNEVKGYNFFQLVRMLEKKIESNDELIVSLRSSLDFIKFKQRPNFSFRQNQIESLKYDKSKECLNIIVNFFGLLGVNSPMPYFFTEYALDLVKEKNYSLLDFLDIFHHRTIILFYKAWKVNQQIVSFELNNDNSYCKYLSSMIGQNYGQTNDYSDLPINAKLYYCGHLMNMTKSAESLRGILLSFFKIPVNIKEFVTQWIEIPKESKMIINNKNEIQLGKNSFVGEKVFSKTAKYKVVMGPMKLDKYKELLPNSKWHKYLIAWIKLCSPSELNCDVQLLLMKNQVPLMKSGARLGYSSWVHSKCKKNEYENFEFSVL
jgi:type VI secretion system protein ImpH